MNSTPRPLVIYGTAGFAREVHQLVIDLAASATPFSCEGFLVDQEYRDSESIHGLPVLGDAGWLAGKRGIEAVIAIGATAPRRRIAQRIAAMGSPFATLVHPRAWIGKWVSVGEGSIVCAGAVATADIVLGRHVQLHVNATVGHDTTIADYVTIAPGANVSGRVRIGEGAFVGAGAVILPDVSIGSGVTVGAGAVVTKDVPNESVVAGVPARMLARSPGARAVKDDLRARTKPRAFTEEVLVTRPLLPPLDAYAGILRGVWERQRLTNKGPLHDELERVLCARLGVENLSLVANGTLALLIALKAMKLSGEVIVTPFTFSATVNAIRWAGLDPVFADIDPVHLMIDPERVERAITPRTCAILGVHVYGIACQVHALGEIARRHGLRLVYDGAHAFGITVDGKPVLDFGDATCLSFHATKLFNTGEGGAIVANDPALKARCDLLRNHGISDEVTVPVPGMNAKMSELAAALGLANLGVMAAEIAGRAAVSAVYRERLADIRGLQCVAAPAGNSERHSYFVIRIDSDAAPLSRDSLYERLQCFNVFTRRYFFPLCSEMPPYVGLPSSAVENLPVATKVSREVLALPFYAGIGADGAHHICDIIRYIFDNARH